MGAIGGSSVGDSAASEWHAPTGKHVHRQPEDSRPALSIEADAMVAPLRHVGLTPQAIVELDWRAGREGATAFDIVLGTGRTREPELYRSLAEGLGVAFIETVAPCRLLLAGEVAHLMVGPAGAPLVVQASAPGGELVYVSAPTGSQLDALRRWLLFAPELRSRLRVTTPGALRHALLAIAEAELRRKARDGLFVSRPDLSARINTNTWQGIMIGCLLVGLPVALAAAPMTTWLAIHLAGSLFFWSCILLRLAAALSPVTRPAPGRVLCRPENMPFYSIMVALRDEVDVLPDLLTALGRLQWPRGRFEIKIVCEHDDHATLGALAALPLRRWVEVVVVPPGMPRTKPNALTYALPMLRGDIVAVYDAEDRPHPLQLVEAWQAFAAAGPGLACVQAPLEVENAAAGLMQRLFALEYAALFRRQLPFMARHGLFFPLGGTSNHFRRSALEAVGAWDPYNVTEDADLGLRLVRSGYRLDVITLPTGEDAPDTARVWSRQRTRWIKGWAQTWLVHMRRPRRCAAELGWLSFVMMQVVLAGMIASAVLHPLMLATALMLGATLLMAGPLGPVATLLLWLDLASLGFAYGSFLLLGWQATPAPRRRRFWLLALAMPAYWMMMSLAAWRALPELYRAPHHWAKTPHKRRWRPGQSERAAPPGVAARRKSGPLPITRSSSGPIASRSRPS